MLSMELIGMLGLLFAAVTAGMVATQLGRRSAAEAGTPTWTIKSA